MFNRVIPYHSVGLELSPTYKYSIGGDIDGLKNSDGNYRYIYVAPDICQNNVNLDCLNGNSNKESKIAGIVLDYDNKKRRATLRVKVVNQGKRDHIDIVVDSTYLRKWER